MQFIIFREGKCEQLLFYGFTVENNIFLNLDNLNILFIPHFFELFVNSKHLQLDHLASQGTREREPFSIDVIHSEAPYTPNAFRV